MFMGCVPKTVVVAFQHTGIFNSSGYFNLHSKYRVGIPHFVPSCCSQAFRFLSAFETISQACFDLYFYFPYASVFSCVYWLFGVSLLWFAYLLPLSTALSGCLLLLSCSNSLSVTCICIYLILLCSLSFHFVFSLPLVF